MINVCTLGTGGSIPMPDRALSSLYLRHSGRALLIDCGEGTQTQIRRLGWGFLCIDGLLITHYHGDHCGGLPGFLLSLDKAGRKAPFPIYGPVGLHHIIEGLMVIAPALSFPLELHELPMHGAHFEVCGLSVDAFPLDHGVPCLGYRLELPRPPKFDPQRAAALGIPMRCWGLLQNGSTVQADGRTYHPEQVLGQPRRGLSLLYATDTRPVPAIADMGAGTDLMVLEGMYGDDAKLPQALKNHHMLFREAAALAAQAGARQLLLTHFSNSLETPVDFLEQAQAVFPQTVLGEDLFTLSLNYQQERA